MAQTRRASALEAVCNVGAGLVIAMITQAALYPAFGIRLGLSQHLTIALSFTAVSLVRSYALRRLFKAWGRRPCR